MGSRPSQTRVTPSCNIKNTKLSFRYKNFTQVGSVDGFAL